MKTFQVTAPSGQVFTVSNEPLPRLEQAPEPYRSQVAAYWYVNPFMTKPWEAFAVDPVNHNSKLDQFERVQGVFPQRRDWVAQGGAIGDFMMGRGRYDQDYELFLGIIDTPSDLAQQLAAAQPVFEEYGLGKAGCYLFANRRTDAAGQAENPDVVNLFFEKAPLPPPASKNTGRLKWRAEAVDQGMKLAGARVVQIIADYQKTLIEGGIWVPKLHPQVQQGLHWRNDAVRPAQG